MRYSQLLIPTVKEVPAEAEIPSHQFMIRAGLIRKLASGTYTYLPLGWRSLLKIVAIVRQEMDAAGAQEICMPILQPAELWQKTGRDVVFKDILCSFEDRHGRGNVLAPTAEEVVTDLVAHEVRSYKQLPVNLYQIHDKFRDEFRPQYGVVRSREFLMKDAYSFDATVEGLNKSYKKMFDAYARIFRRCGLKTVVVQAESGGMGGTDTEEFMVPAAVGDVLVTTEDGSYAANLEKADVDAVAPPANIDQQRGAVGPMEEIHTPNVGSIEAVCKFLGTQPAEMMKTLIYESALTDAEIEVSQKAAQHDGRKALTSTAHAIVPYVVIIRGDHEVNEAKLNRLAGETVKLADAATIQRISGAPVGFAGPIGIGDRGYCRIFIEHSVAAMPCGMAGANKNDHHVKNVVPGRDFPLTGQNVVVADIRNAVPGDTYRGKPLKFSNGIEVGHVFKLGTKYSEQLSAVFLDEQGKSHPCIMGCYGIGINRILACAIEQEGGHDANGCVLPASIAPFEVVVVPLNCDKKPVMDAAEGIYRALRDAGADVLLDDRDERAGVKFKDADLIGFPLRIVIGEKGLKDGKVELKRRTDAAPTLLPVAEAASRAAEILREMKASLACE